MIGSRVRQGRVGRGPAVLRGHGPLVIGRPLPRPGDAGSLSEWTAGRSCRSWARSASSWSSPGRPARTCCCGPRPRLRSLSGRRVRRRDGDSGRGPHLRRRRHGLDRRRRRGVRLRRRRPAGPVRRGRRQPGGPLPKRQPRLAGALRVRAGRGRGHRPRGRDRRLPARHRRRWPRRPGRPARRRGGPAARPRRLPLRARERGVVVRRRRRTWTTAFSATWEGAAALPTLAFGNYVEPRRRRATRPTRVPTTSCSGPTPSGSGYATADPPRARLLFAVDAVQRLGPIGAPRPAGQQRPPLLRQPERPGAAVAGRRRASRHACTPPTTAGSSMQIWGMGIASYDVTGDGYPDVYLTSQGRTCSRRCSPDRPSRRTGTSPSSAASRRRDPSAGRRPAAVDRLAPRVPGRQQRRLHRPVRVQGQRQRGSPTTPPGIRATCSSAQPDGTFTEARQQAGIVSFDRGRGAALADFNLDGLLDLVEVNLDAPVRLWRNVGAGTAADAGADGTLAGLPAPPAGSQPRRDRGPAGGPGRRPDAAPRADGRRRARRRAARLDACRARPGARGPTSAYLARR